MIIKKGIKNTKKADTKPVKKRSILGKIADKITRVRPSKIAKIEHTPVLKRVENNPIITPSETNSWESKATFNPGAIYSGGIVHLVYRAIGYDDVSVLGYASSNDGININERLTYPICSRSQKRYETLAPKIPYSSGEGWNGGCEDPRLTVIDDTVYLLYTAFDGWGSLRMAMAKISLDDFVNKRFRWDQPVYISKPREIHKNWVLFPEKIGGKFAILHSINPKIWIEYVDSMDELGRDKYIKSVYGSREAHDKKNAERWDSWVRGAGPPPLKTKYGWLLLYHAMSDRDPNRYKLGAMILDLKDPSKVLYRSKKALLEPDECYENEGFKSGVVYSCGAVIIPAPTGAPTILSEEPSGDEELYVYYGGADTVVCVATANLEELLQQIMADQKPVLKRVSKDLIKVKK